MNGEYHNHSTKDNKRRTQKQPQEHIDAVLHLINITGHTGDERCCADGIQLRKAEGLDMGQQVTAQSGGRADGCLGREELSRKAAGKAQNRHQQHHP